MLENARFIKNDRIRVENRDAWRNMGFNDKKKLLPDKGGIPNFRRRIQINKPIRSVFITATALGIFDLFVNNERVGEYNNDGKYIYDELKPGWTDYSKRVFAFTYDITKFIKNGENIILAEVSCGWYSCRISFGIYGFKSPAFCAEIRIEYADGTHEKILTDDTWETALTGPVRAADIWDGEYYDASFVRGEADVWEKPTVEDYDGKITDADESRILVRTDLERKPESAVLYEGVKDNGTDFGEINIIEKRENDGCERIRMTKGQKLVLDMGQNLVGRPNIHVKAKLGTKITIYFGEMLNDSGSKERGNDDAKGSVYVKNYRAALSRLVYVTGEKEETEYSPKHTFYGYRYLEMETDGDIEILNVRSEILSSIKKETATFECSNAEVNMLWSNIVWGQRGNYLSVPTDCPQRDERLGWTGDTQIFCGAGSYIADIYDFMNKWTQDIRDAQCDDGSYPDVIPKVFKNEKFIGNAAWGDAGIIVPYTMYKKYGKLDIIRRHYNSMERYMNYLSKNGLDGANTAYGDWLSYEETDKRLISIGYYAYTATIMSVCSALLSKKEKAKHYFELVNDIRKHFIELYVDENGLKEKTQTAYLMALRFNLLPAELRKSAAEELRKKIEDNDYTLSTGFVGTGMLCMTLSELGMSDLCYSLLLQTKDPSWLYSVRQGATTVWERWNSYTVEKGFGNVEMNSFNHYAYGAVAEWMMAYMAGIRTEKPGFSHILISPKVDRREFIPEGQERITYVSASYESASGLIKSSWKHEGDKYIYDIEVPGKATIQIEHHGSRDSFELTCDDPKNIVARVEGDSIAIDVGEGKYHIVI